MSAVSNGSIDVALRFPAGSEQRVEARGSWDNWQGSIVLDKHGDSWVKTVSLAPGSYQYKFMVDGQWRYIETQPHVKADGVINNVLFVQGSQACPSGNTLRVVCFNIRYDTQKDLLHPWKARVDHLCATLLYSRCDFLSCEFERTMRQTAVPIHGVLISHRADFIALQEVLHNQLQDIIKGLQGQYSFVGVGRGDGQTSGEYSPILYRTDRFAPLSSTTFWLSQTPDDVGSKGWGCKLPRICSVGVFRDLLLQRTVVVANTHLDHEQVPARKNGMQLIVDRLRGMMGNNLTILTGDWNEQPNLATYNVASTLLEDTSKLAQQLNHEWSHTFCDFVPQHTYPSPQHDKTIDYVFATPGTKVALHSILGVHHEHVQISDHRPIVVDIVL